MAALKSRMQFKIHTQMHFHNTTYLIFPIQVILCSQMIQHTSLYLTQHMHVNMMAMALNIQSQKKKQNKSNVIKLRQIRSH